MEGLQKRRKWKRRICILFLVVLPLLCFPEIRTQLKFQHLLEKGDSEGLIRFAYADNRKVSCYIAEGEREDAGDAYVFIPSFGDLEHLRVDTPAFKAVFTAEDGEQITVRQYGRKTRAFRENVPYRMQLQDIRGKVCVEWKVTFLKSGKLPTVYVNTESGSMEWLDEDKDRKEEGYMEIVDEQGRTLLSDVLKSISARGNQTFKYDKKSYHVKLGSAADLFDMGESNSWILLSNVYDPSYIRNKLAYDMALQADMEGSTQSVYVDVYFNGAYHGMYLLCEKIELGKNRLEMKNLEKENKKLNGNLDEAYRWLSEDETRKGIEVSNIPEDITGGYLIEHDYNGKYEVELSGFITEGREKYVLKSPRHATRQEVNYIADRMQDLEYAILAEDGCSPVTGTHFTEYIDLESWADKYIIEEITRNNAGGLTSSFFYKKPDSVSTKIYGGPVWDFDKAFGRVPNFNRNVNTISYLTLHDHESTYWFYYLSKQPEFMEMVRKEYREKFSDYLEEMAEKKIAEYTAQIEEAAQSDSVRFRDIYEGYQESMNDYLERGAYIRRFLLERKAFLDEVWLGEAEIRNVRFEREDGRLLYVIGVKAGDPVGELPKVINMGWPNADRWVIQGTDVSLTEDTQITEDMTVIGVWDEYVE